jgi:hypothetical protein
MALGSTGPVAQLFPATNNMLPRNHLLLTPTKITEVVLMAGGGASWLAWTKMGRFRPKADFFVFSPFPEFGHFAVRPLSFIQIKLQSISFGKSCCEDPGTLKSSQFSSFFFRKLFLNFFQTSKIHIKFNKTQKK